MNMDIRNCVPYEGHDKKYKYYMIIDTKEHLADECFNRKQLDVQYRSEWSRRKNEYIIRECRVDAEKEDEFQAALRELMVVMHVKGHDDYREACSCLSKEAMMLTFDSDTSPV